MITLANIRKRCEFTTTSSLVVEKSPREIESENISKILPDDLYKDVAQILDLDIDIKQKLAAARKKTYRKLYKDVKNLTRALHGITIDKSHTSDEYYTGSSVEPPTPKDKSKGEKVNPYYNFFQKTEREQVRWESKYLPPETESEKGLIRRAEELTNKICADFCNYMQSLGGYDSPMFKEDIVKQLFQIEFNAHITKSVKTRPKKLKSITKQVADSTKCPKIYHKTVLNAEIRKDIDADAKSSKKVAFGKNLPKNMQRKQIKNNTKKNWSDIHNLSENITTMENVWGNITKFKSVQDFCQWIINHPVEEYPTYLESNKMFDESVLKKVKHFSQFDCVNQLPDIDLHKQLSNEYKIELILPPIDMKIY